MIYNTVWHVLAFQIVASVKAGFGSLYCDLVESYSVSIPVWPDYEPFISIHIQ